MALAIGVGVPPQYGLYTAIVAGFFVAALGGSRTQVTGPTAAFIVILAPIYVKSEMAGLLISRLLGGIIMIAMGPSASGASFSSSLTRSRPASPAALRRSSPRYS